MNTLDSVTQLRHANKAIDELTKENEELKAKINLSLGDVMCRFSFKGVIIKEHFYILLKYLDDMKLRGWVFEKHTRKNGKNSTLEIDYVFVKYGT